MVTSCRTDAKTRDEWRNDTQTMDFLNYVFWNNTVLDYIVFLGVLAIGVALIFALGRVTLKRLASYFEKTQSAYGQLTLSGIKQYLLPTAYFTLFYACTRLLVLNDKLAKIVRGVSVLFAIVMGAIFLSSLAALFFTKLGKGKGDSASLHQMAHPPEQSRNLGHRVDFVPRQHRGQDHVARHGGWHRRGCHRVCGAEYAQRHLLLFYDLF